VKRTNKKCQYTIRAVPEDVDRALRQRARRQNRSLNHVALEALRRGVGLDSGERVYNDLDHLIGTWVEDPEFDRAIKEQDRVDPDPWH
jgi:plasmid stability protein